MAKYLCQGFKPVLAEGHAEAAKIFAERLARRRYGKKGYCHHVSLQSWTRNGIIANYQAFIGKPARRGCEGGNVYLSVHKD